MKPSKIHRRNLFLVLGILTVLCVLTQLQPWIVERVGGVAGSFGVRPLTHACMGLTYENGLFPAGEMDMNFIRFHFRYSVNNDASRPLCIGQDIWYGE
jgi:hypothetical protein